MTPAQIQSLITAFQQAQTAGQSPAEIAQKLSAFVAGQVNTADITPATESQVQAALAANAATVLQTCLALIQSQGDGAYNALLVAFEADPNLKTAAQSLLNNTNALAAICGNNTIARDYISAQQQKWLTQALS